jgi:hypothetical protein
MVLHAGGENLAGIREVVSGLVSCSRLVHLKIRLRNAFPRDCHFELITREVADALKTIHGLKTFELYTIDVDITVKKRLERIAPTVQEIRECVMQPRIDL